MNTRTNASPISIDAVFLGNRVALRAPKLSDAPQIIEMQRASRDFLAPWVPAQADNDLDLALVRKRISEQGRQFKADRDYKFVFTLGQNGPVIGRVSLSQVFRGIFQNAYLGYSIDVRYKRRGLTSEAVRLALDVAFGPLGLHRVQAAIMPHNEASLALIRGLGLRWEGKAERYLKIADVWQDHLMFAATAEEWPIQHSTPVNT